MKDVSEEVWVVLVTTASREEADRLATELVDRHLVACANCIHPIRSVFFWEGKRCEEEEALLILKTRASAWEALVKAIRQRHSYSVPEILALPVRAGNPDYLQWVLDTVVTPSPKA